MAAQFRFAKIRLSKPQIYWKNGQTKPKWKSLRITHSSIFHLKPNTGYQMSLWEVIIGVFSSSTLWGQRSYSSSFAETRSRNRTMIPITPANLQQSYTVKLQTSTQLKCCGGTWKKAVHKLIHANLNKPKQHWGVPPQQWRWHWYSHLKNSYF